MTVTAVDERLLTPERLAELRAAIELAISGEWDVLDALDLQFSTAIALIDALEAARKEIAGLREGLRPTAGMMGAIIPYLTPDTSIDEVRRKLTEAMNDWRSE